MRLAIGVHWLCACGGLMGIAAGRTDGLERPSLKQRVQVEHTKHTVHTKARGKQVCLY